MIYEREMKALVDSGSRYLVIGGIAVLLHGYIRNTHDLDILADMSESNLDKIIKTLTDLHYIPKVPVNPNELKDPQKREFWRTEKNMKAFSFIDCNNLTRIVDILIYSNLDFEKAYKNRKIVQLESTKVSLASIRDIIALKKEALRPRDVDDIDHLERLV